MTRNGINAASRHLVTQLHDWPRGRVCRDDPRVGVQRSCLTGPICDCLLRGLSVGVGLGSRTRVQREHHAVSSRNVSCRAVLCRGFQLGSTRLLKKCCPPFARSKCFWNLDISQLIQLIQDIIDTAWIKPNDIDFITTQLSSSKSIADSVLLTLPRLTRPRPTTQKFLGHNHQIALKKRDATIPHSTSQIKAPLHLAAMISSSRTAPPAPIDIQSPSLAHPPKPQRTDSDTPLPPKVLNSFTKCSDINPANNAIAAL